MGPDITAVGVSNSDVGLITFNVTTGPVPESIVAAWLDTDLNPMTGRNGVERVVMLALEPSGVVLTAIGDPNGNLDVGMLFAASYANGVVTFSIPKETLGVTDAFSFWLSTSNMADDSAWADEAPDVGFWTYVLTKPAPPVAVKPVIGKPVAMGAPVAGRKFVVRLPITRSDDGTPMTTAAVSCTTTVAGKTVPHTHTFKSGTVRAVVALPKAAKGKQLKVTVRVVAQNQAATKVVTFKIR